MSASYLGRLLALEELSEEGEGAVLQADFIRDSRSHSLEGARRLLRSGRVPLLVAGLLLAAMAAGFHRGSWAQGPASAATAAGRVAAAAVPYRGPEDLAAAAMVLTEEKLKVIMSKTDDRTDPEEYTKNHTTVYSNTTRPPLMHDENVSYHKISEGTCRDAGLFPITEGKDCALAADALGIRDTHPHHVWWVRGAPEGCYMKGNTTLWLSTNSGSVGVGASHGREPLCVSEAATKTTTSPQPTTTTWGHPSLLCFAVMRAYTEEEKLIKVQFAAGLGIFACDEYIVISNKKRYLGRNAAGSPTFSWLNKAPKARKGDLAAGQKTNSWLNTQVFISAMDTILSDSERRWHHHDVLVKADPDSVFFPDRLRLHVKSHVPGAFFFANCLKYGKAWLYGALEVFSKEAIAMYEANTKVCKGLPWRGWGEDMFFRKCMDALGVPMVNDFALVGDSRCMAAPCSDGWRAAYHPFKDPGSWMGCWHASARA